MQTDKSRFKKVPRSHFVPAVVIRIADYKTGEHKEKINREIAMMYGLNREIRIIGLEQVKNNDQYSGGATQSVKNGVMWFQG